MTLIRPLSKVFYRGRYVFFVIFVCLLASILTSYFNLASFSQLDYKVTDLTESMTPSKFLIDTSRCKIPDLDPYNKEVLPFITKEKYVQCSKLPLLTYIEKNNGVVTLKVNKSVIPLYANKKLSCCYSKILRIMDKDVSYTKCEQFENEVELTYPFIRVICTTFFGLVYENVHATATPTKNKQDVSNNATKPKYSILLLGIDSISKLNLQRTMPNTFQYLEKNLINLRGYNKIGDNTFPNLMAILTGRNMSQLEPGCKTENYIDDCDIIWKRFKDIGHVTAYSEDEAGIGTFNFCKPGFRNPPTDFYYRPYMLAAQKLPITYKYGLSFCTGPENSAERILNTAKDFVLTFQDRPRFGLFWMNSFSHENINLPSAMDEKMLEFLSDDIFLKAINEDTFLVFFSDHGFRFGDIRFTYTGWLEERLPYMYVKLPDSFKKRYPLYLRNFILNAESRLTTPFDLYMTLQEILKISNDAYEIKPSLGCAKCQSLFTVLPENRSCSDAGINRHWCTCDGHTYVHPKLKIVQTIAKFIVNQLNEIIQGFPKERSKCRTYEFEKVVTAAISKRHTRDTDEYLMLIETYPQAMFEATVEHHKTTSELKLTGDISRLNKYADYSQCVEDSVLKKYCFCNNLMTKFRSTICKVFGC